MPYKIKFTDIIQNLDEKAKVRFNQWNGTQDPMQEYIRNPDIVNNGWFLWHNKQRYFSLGQTAISFLKLRGSKWLLTTIKRITKVLSVENAVGYEAEEIEEYKPFFGRVIVEYHKQEQAQGRWLSEIKDELEVLQILPAEFDGDNFPGYDKVRLSWKQLETIISRYKPDWIAALENQKAVYLISDTLTGKHYVGSATAQRGMLLQRWTNYVNNGHGGNVGLKNFSFDYIKQHFRYSILENYNAKVDDKIILTRESWWKETLLTRNNLGYNHN